MDISNYILYRDRELVSVQEVEGEKKIVKRRFDPDTGDETDGEIQDIDTEWIDTQIAYHQNEIDNLNAMKADLEEVIPKI